jgi:CheY-like chemotaxis protein
LEDCPQPGERVNVILIVDENLDYRLSLRELLQARGYRVVTVEGAVQAIEVMGRQPVSVVIADVIMLQMSGSFLLRRLQALGRTAGG